mgnify:CR=1 FL=1
MVILLFLLYQKKNSKKEIIICLLYYLIVLTEASEEVETQPQLEHVQEEVISQDIHTIEQVCLLANFNLFLVLFSF